MGPVRGGGPSRSVAGSSRCSAAVEGVCKLCRRAYSVRHCGIAAVIIVQMLPTRNAVVPAYGITIDFALGVCCDSSWLALMRVVTAKLPTINDVVKMHPTKNLRSGMACTCVGGATTACKAALIVTATINNISSPTITMALTKIGVHEIAFALSSFIATGTQRMFSSMAGSRGKNITQNRRHLGRFRAVSIPMCTQEMHLQHQSARTIPMRIIWMRVPTQSGKAIILYDMAAPATTLDDIYENAASARTKKQAKLSVSLVKRVMKACTENASNVV
jgi:hypothetical protein